MSATLQESLGGLGQWSFDLRSWDPEILAECVVGRIVRLYEGYRPIKALLILTRSTTEAHPMIGGQEPAWRLGAGDSGPLIESREYVAGTDKLANGDFSLGDLYYRFGQGTHWSVPELGPASVAADSGADDVLESDETFLTAPGHQYRLTIVSSRATGTVGRLRGRVTIDGRFATPNLLTNGDLALGPGHGWGTATDIAIVTDPDDATRYAMRIGPSTRPDRLVNGDFQQGALVGWTVVANSGRAPLSVITDDLTAYEVIYAPGPGTYEVDWHNGTADGGGFLADFQSFMGAGFVCTYSSSTGFYTATPVGAPDGGVLAASLQSHVDGWNKDLQLGTHRRRAMYDGDFESGSLAAWHPSLPGVWSINADNREGNWAAELDGAVAAGAAAMFAITPPEEAHVPGNNRRTLVDPTEKWRFEGYVKRDVAVPPDGEAWAELQFYKADLTTLSVTQTAHLSATDPVGTWRQIVAEAQVPGADYTNLVVALQGTPTAGFWRWDSLWCERIEGNEELVSSTPMAVAAGEEYTFLVVAKSEVGFVSGAVFPRVTVSGPGLPDKITELNPISETGQKWFGTAEKVTIEAGYDTAVVVLRARDITVNPISVDNCSFMRTRGNVDRLAHDPIAVTPGRTYVFGCDIRSDFSTSVDEPGVTNDSSAALVATLSAAGRPDVIVEGSPLKPTAGVQQRLELSVTPPSGYDTATLAVKSIDIVGGSFWARNLRLVDQDGSTIVDDLVISSTVAGTHSLDVTVPAGGQKIRVQLVAESGGRGWTVDEWHLQRIGVTPATVSEILAELLSDSSNGEHLLEVGTVHNDGPISHDWTITNTHNLEALDHLLAGGVAPTLQEFRVNPDLTVDVGTAEQLYVDRTELVLTKYDMVVLEDPEVVEDRTTYVSHIKVIGAERQTASGDTIAITATATVPWARPLLDSGGIPLVRTKMVTDSSVNHPLYARALAAFLADQEAAVEQPLVLKLSDTSARSSFELGDWLEVFDRDAGVEGDLERVDSHGSTVFPRPLRVVERTREFGAGFRAEIVREDGSTFDITDWVMWSPATTMEVHLGALSPQFAIDNEGGAAYKQFLRFRASAAA